MDAINRTSSNRQQINKSLILSLLIIIMDLSGMAGAIVELDESAERQETHSGLNMPGFQAGLVSSLQTFDIHDDGESACAVLDDNSLWCWGSGSNYALGSGNSNSATTPQAVGRPGGWVNKTISVSLGGNHNCELLSTGDVQCWGTNYPTGTSTPGGSADSGVEEPEPVLGLARDAVLVAAGSQHSCAILDNGSVQCWGYNYHGQLGLGYRCVTGAEGSCGEDSLGTDYIGFPRDMILPAGKTAIGLNLWSYNTCVILSDNSYVCTGELNGVHHSTPIYVNGSHSVAFADAHHAVSTSGESLRLGQQASGLSTNYYGMQTYDRNTANTSYTNTQYHNDSIKSIDGSYYYWGYTDGYGSCIIYDDDVLRCGQLASYTNNPDDYYGYLTYAVIENPTGLIPAAAVSKNLQMSCVVYDDGSLKCWGINNGGQIGDGSVCVYGTSDTTGCTSGNYVNSLREVSFPAGRHIALSDLDTDGDGIVSSFDGCPSSSISWTSTTSNDYDQDGCRDVDEDSDDNGDGITDNDYDSDGYGDIVDPDDDNDGVTDTDADGDGLGDDIDFDGDGYVNFNDDLPYDSNEWIDSDSDGVGNNADTDDDNDGYTDSLDLYPTDAYAYQNFAQIDSFTHGIRYENVTAAGNKFITEDGNLAYIYNYTNENYASQPSFRSLSDHGNYRIFDDGTVHDHTFFTTNDPVSMIAEGSNHRCALLESGTVQCWGSNSMGQLGDGTRTQRNTPINVIFPSNSGTPIGLALDKYEGYFSCALMDDGDVYCWGDAAYAGLGSQVCGIYANFCESGYLLQPVAPAQFSTSSPVISITGPTSYRVRVCAVHEDGTASCWGKQDYGELGNGYTGQQSWYPTPVSMPSGSGNITQISSSNYVTCALMDDGDIYCWGRNEHGELGDGTVCPSGNFENNCNGNTAKPVAYEKTILPTGTSALSIWSKDSQNSCALLDNGRIYCWGYSDSYSDGIGMYYSLSGLFVKQGNRDWDSDGVFNGQDNCAAGTQGWTSSPSNDLDNDGCIDSTEDLDDDGDNFLDSTEIDCGTDPLNSSDYPVDTDGDGLCAPYDDDDDGDGVLDVNDAFPDDGDGFVHLTLGDGFQSGQPLDNVSLGGTMYSNCAILTDSSVKCWGSNNYGEIGDGSVSTTRYVPVNISMPAGKIARSLSHGSMAQHMCMVTTDGSLYCWGSNYEGEIGDGSVCTSNSYLNDCNGQTGRSSPVEVTLPTGKTATAVSTGYRFTCAILDDGKVYCWGENNYGQLGVGNTSSGLWAYSPSQTLIPEGRTASAISAGQNHACAVLDDNSLVCWGYNGNYQLGDGTSTTRSSPVYAAFSGSGNASIYRYNSVVTSNGYTCAISTDNKAYCWGYNAHQRLGNSSRTSWSYYNTPGEVSIPISRSVMGISLGSNQACAVLDDESLYCWGQDDNNRLNTVYECISSDYTNGCWDSNRNTPAQSSPPSGRTMISVSLGYSHTCTMIDNGGIYCFGVNDNGQLGNGSTYGNGPHFVSMPVGLSPTTSDRDSDHDGIFNNADRCLNGATGWTSNSSTDNDFDGCRDSDEDLDDDNDDWTDTDELACGTQSLNSTSIPLDTDGDLTCDVIDTDDDNDSLVDASDDCSAGEIGWISNSSTDYDSDGCQDSGEDTDDDNDSISDTYDSCTPGELSWTSSTSTDYDTDGCQDSSEDTDDDNDNVIDSLDLCPTGQLGWSSDSSTDNDGDGCKDSTSEDLDDDNDGWSDVDETACGTQTLDSSSIPLDTDGDLTCDVVDTDDDNDGYIDSNDAFPLDSTEWVDTDSDGTGNNADTDDDNDGWSDALEISCGTLPLDSSSTPVDTDLDGTCNYLDTDDDNDGVLDTNDAFPLDNTEWDDTDSDGTGNNADSDDDGDGWVDTEEISCGTLPLDSSSTPVDTDLDGTCNYLDTDDDNDGVLDTDDAFPLDSTEWDDTDSDGIGNNADTDDDNDGFNDGNDTFPLDNNEWDDTDNDTIGNNADLDDDGDGWNDAVEISCGTDSLNSSSIPVDTDLDGICNTLDVDDDNDGFNDENDTFPLNNNEWLDTDNDTIGNNADIDDDGDGWNDTAEINCGTDSLNSSSIPLDTDLDGICNTLDTDDDDDGYLDSNDTFPLDNTEWLDTDNDTIGNNADTDDDGDNVTDSLDAFPLDSTEWEDTDGDGIGNNADLDDDNDGLSDAAELSLGTNSTNPDTDGDNYSDGSDAFPLDNTEWNDTDGDGVGNNADLDDDGDSWDDSIETSCASDPLDNSSIPLDTDSDGDCDLQDTDDDNDGTLDVDDAFPLDASADTDTDGDGMPDVINGATTTNLTEDWDDDNDGWNDTIEIDCGYDPQDSNHIPIDSDNDTICDTLDIFPNDPNEWEDTDGDGVGDNGDVFPTDSTEWNDTDGDGVGDNADPDADNDGWFDNEENQCGSDWLNSTSVPSDVDNDGLCNEMDSDADNDSWSNDEESNCLTDWLSDTDIPLDTDGDGICDVVDGDDDNDLYPDDQDAFPLDYFEWQDSDGDGIGNNQDPDDDNDGCMDVSDALPLDPTECLDNDGDGYGNNADPDDDNDGTLDYFDDFPLDASAITDTDNDGMPDDIIGNSTTGLVEDIDDDNDGYNDTEDAFPLDLNEWIDTDGDGQGNNADPDDDGDSCVDIIDLFPLDPAECYDNDLDGIGDNADTDDDNDGWLDNTELICGTSNPFDAASVPDDFDQDGICDVLDYDDDNDSFIDVQDAFPFDPCANLDTDGDGLPDYLFFNCNTTLVEDWDDDNDGYNDTNDSFPQDPTEWFDFDMDGLGDNYDTDDDGDMVPDTIDLFPLNASEWFDNDGDGIGDNSDLDDDNDGTEDIDDDFPLVFGITTDTDGDGLPDNMTADYNGTLSEDLDDDGDGVLDIYDLFPLDSSEWSDTDLDGIGNNADSDDDGDGWSDSDEYICGSDTLDANDVPDDSDGDGICDSEDDEDLTTLSGRAEYYLKSPVTVWMALVGVLAGLIGGITSSSMRGGKDREKLFGELRDFTDSVKDHQDYQYSQPVGSVTIPNSQLTDSNKIKELVDQGYSQEVAEALIESQK